VDGLAYSLHHPTVCRRQRGGQSFLTGIVSSYHAAVGGAVFSGNVKPPGLDILRGVDRPITYKTESYMEKPAFTKDMLIRHQSYHGDYACNIDRVAMFDGDGMDSCTRVPVARSTWGMWPCPVMPDSKYHRFTRPWCLVKIYLILEAPWWSDWMPRPVPGRGGRRAEQTSGEILSAHVY
jgi:hypothetical protein